MNGVRRPYSEKFTKHLQKDATLTNFDKSSSYTKCKEATLDKGTSTIKKLKVEETPLLVFEK